MSIDFQTIGATLANTSGNGQPLVVSNSNISINNYYWATGNVATSGQIDLASFGSPIAHKAYYPMMDQPGAQRWTLSTGAWLALPASSIRWKTLTGTGMSPSAAFCGGTINFIATGGMYYNVANTVYKNAFATETNSSLTPSLGGVLSTNPSSWRWQTTPCVGNTPTHGINWGGYYVSTIDDLRIYKYIFSSDTVTSVINGNTTGVSTVFNYGGGSYINTDGGICWSWGDKMRICPGFSNGAFPAANTSVYPIPSGMVYTTATDAITYKYDQPNYGGVYSAHVVSPTKGYMLGALQLTNLPAGNVESYIKSTDTFVKLTSVPGHTISYGGYATHDQSWAYYQTSGAGTGRKFSYATESVSTFSTQATVDSQWQSDSFAGISNLGFPK